MNRTNFTAGYHRIIVLGIMTILVMPLVLATRAMAQPAAMTQYYKSMPGTDRYPLVLGFCLFGEHGCVEREADAWGQICSSSFAAEIGTRKSGTYRGIVPPLFRYAGFRCGWKGSWHNSTEVVHNSDPEPGVE